MRIKTDKLAGPGLLLVLSILFHWKLVLTNQYTWLEAPDLGSLVMPWFQFQAGEWHHFRFPLWDPYSWAGQPLFGQAQPGAAYPINWLLFWMPLTAHGWLRQDVLHWFYVLVHYTAGLSAYALCRDLGRSRLAAVLGGLVYSLAGYVAYTDWPQMLQGAVWAPLVFLFLFRVDRGVRPVASAVLSGFFLGVAWLVGHHQMQIFLSLAVAGVWAWMCVRERRVVVLAALAFLMTGMTSAFQTLPAAEYGRLAVRWVGAEEPQGLGETVPYPVHEQYALKPISLIGIFVAGVEHGPYDAYCGVAALSFAVLGAIWFWREKYVRWLAVIGGCGILLALGGNSVFHGMFYALAPLVEKARVPAAATVLFAVGVSTLAAFGVDGLRRGAMVPGVEMSLDAARTSAGATGAIGGTDVRMAGEEKSGAAGGSTRGSPADQGVCPRQISGMGRSLGKLFCGDTSVDTARTSSCATTGPGRNQVSRTAETLGVWILAGFGTVLGLGCLGFYAARVPMDGRMVMTAFCAVLAAGVLITRSPVAAIALVLFELGNVTDANLATADQKTHPYLYKLGADYDVAAVVRGSRFVYDGQAIPYNIGDWYGIEAFNAYAASVPASLWRLPVFANRVQDILGIRYYLGLTAQRTDVREVFRGRNGIKVFENDKAFPRVWAVHRAVRVDDAQRAREMLADPGFDAAQEVFLMGESAPKLEACGDDEISMSRHEPNFLAIHAAMSCRGMVILTDTWFPGWKATVDGKAVAIEKVFGTFRGVVVEGGEHAIEMRYRPWSVFIGGVLTALAGMVALWMWFGGERSWRSSVSDGARMGFGESPGDTGLRSLRSRLLSLDDDVRI